MTSVLGNSIRRLVGQTTRSQRGDRQAEVVAICARKGGVGKTTSAVNIAAGAARYYDAKVLLVDMDAQGHCASALHSQLRGIATDSLSGVLLGKRRDIQDIVLSTDVPGLYVTPSDKSLGATEGCGGPYRQRVFASALRSRMRAPTTTSSSSIVHLTWEPDRQRADGR